MPYRQNMKLGIMYNGHKYKAQCQICAVSHTIMDEGNALTRGLISEAGLKTFTVLSTCAVT
jgi:hypothetical protein